MNTNYPKCNNYFYERACELFGNMTQQKISVLTGIAQGKISDILGFKNFPDRYENKSPSAETVVKIARGFNVSTDYLLGLTDIKSTDKATKELCDTLGLSEEAIKILSRDSKSLIVTTKAESHLKSYDTFKKMQENGKKISNSRILSVINNPQAAYIEFADSIASRYAEEYSAVFNWLIAEHIESEIKNDSDISLFSYLYDFYTYMTSPHSSTIRQSDIMKAKATQGDATIYPIPTDDLFCGGYSVSELLITSAIINITTKLNSIKETAKKGVLKNDET